MVEIGACTVDSIVGDCQVATEVFAGEDIGDSWQAGEVLVVVAAASLENQMVPYLVDLLYRQVHQEAYLENLETA